MKTSKKEKLLFVIGGVVLALFVAMLVWGEISAKENTKRYAQEAFRRTGEEGASPDDVLDAFKEKFGGGE